MLPAIHLVFFSLVFGIFSLARAEIFVVNPSSTTQCAAGQACQVDWTDDGVTPTSPSLGACTVGLYHGTQQLVQTLDPVNVASTHSLSFTPQANAGPNSNGYYVSFICSAYKVNGTLAYSGYSPNFSLTGMTGSFNSPIASLTSTRPIPASLSTAAATGNLPVSTINATGTPSSHVTSTSSKLTTSRVSLATSTPGLSSRSVSASAATASTSSKSHAVATRNVSALSLVLAVAVVFLS